MTSLVIVGSQWGDEGKGKITDFLSEQANVIVRYQGGNNAGHTIRFNGATHKLHLIPSGIFFPDKICIIGNGLVVDPKALLQEIKGLHEKNISTENLKISDRAHIILPYHHKLDALQEDEKGDEKIGTTKKGIGPAYVDKASRVGIRMIDLLDYEVFSKKLSTNLKEKNRLFEKIYHVPTFSFDEIVEEYYALGQELKKYITDTSVLLHEMAKSGKKILFEGAQGSMLDIDHGTYPYVTSSHPVAGYAAIGSGVGPQVIKGVVGVCKAYTTRVGDGPFPTELQNETGNRIREVGKEYGTTTGRPRRIGWFDAVVVRHACRVNGTTDLSLNSIDVLTGIDTLKLCVGYRYQGKELKELPSSLSVISECEPIYESFPGWHEDITGCKKINDLPENVKNYLKRISEVVGVPISIFSVGPDRNQTNIVQDPWK